MKKILFSALAGFLFALSANAQIPKGSIFIGGQISGGKTVNSGQKQNNFFISPAVATAIKQNLFLGVDLTYGQTKYENNSMPYSNQKGYGGGLFLRKYIPIAKRFYFFAQGRAGYSYDKSEYSGPYISKNTSNTASLSLYPGVSFALSRVLHIETGFNNLALISYSRSTTTQTGFPDQKSSNFNFSTSVAGTSLSFALRFIIP